MTFIISNLRQNVQSPTESLDPAAESLSLRLRLGRLGRRPLFQSISTDQQLRRLLGSIGKRYEDQIGT